MFCSYTILLHFNFPSSENELFRKVLFAPGQSQKCEKLCTIWEIPPPIALLFHKANNPGGNSSPVTNIRMHQALRPQSQLWSLIVHIVPRFSGDSLTQAVSRDCRIFARRRLKHILKKHVLRGNGHSHCSHSMFPLNTKIYLSRWVWLSTGRSGPERLWSLHSRRYSKVSTWEWSWSIYSMWPCLSRGAGAGVLQKCLEISTSLWWFCVSFSLQSSKQQQSMLPALSHYPGKESWVSLTSPLLSYAFIRKYSLCVKQSTGLPNSRRGLRRSQKWGEAQLLIQWLSLSRTDK